MQTSLIKGYEDDAGLDVILSEQVTFKAKQQTIINLGNICTPAPDNMGYLIERTSAAKQGLFVHSCPIDANYEGPVHAIVYNSSDNDVTYNKDEAFCQLVIVAVKTVRNLPCKKSGKRTNSCFGGTDEKY